MRGFARHVTNIDPETEVPRAGILPPLKRAKPYIYSDAEIEALLKAALALPPANGLRRWTYHYLFGLIAVTAAGQAARFGPQTPVTAKDLEILGGALGHDIAAEGSLQQFELL